MGVIEKKQGQYIGFYEKDGIKQQLQPITFLSKEEEDSYDWVINADKELDHCGSVTSDEGSDDEGLLESKSASNVPVLMLPHERRGREGNAVTSCNPPLPKVENENKEQEETKSIDSSSQSNSYPQTIYRVDFVEFIPGTEETHSRQEKRHSDACNESDSNSDSQGLVAFGTKLRRLSVESGRERQLRSKARRLDMSKGGCPASRRRAGSGR